MGRLKELLSCVGKNSDVKRMRKKNKAKRPITYDLTLNESVSGGYYNVKTPDSTASGVTNTNLYSEDPMRGRAATTGALHHRTVSDTADSPRSSLEDVIIGSSTQPGMVRLDTVTMTTTPSTACSDYVVPNLCPEEVSTPSSCGSDNFVPNFPYGGINAAEPSTAGSDQVVPNFSSGFSSEASTPSTAGSDNVVPNRSLNETLTPSSAESDEKTLSFISHGSCDHFTAKLPPSQRNVSIPFVEKIYCDETDMNETISTDSKCHTNSVSTSESNKTLFPKTVNKQTDGENVAKPNQATDTFMRINDLKKDKTYSAAKEKVRKSHKKHTRSSVHKLFSSVFSCLGERSIKEEDYHYNKPTKKPCSPQNGTAREQKSADGCEMMGQSVLNTTRSNPGPNQMLGYFQQNSPGSSKRISNCSTQSQPTPDLKRRSNCSITRKNSQLKNKKPAHLSLTIPSRENSIIMESAHVLMSENSFGDKGAVNRNNSVKSKSRHSSRETSNLAEPKISGKDKSVANKRDVIGGNDCRQVSVERKGDGPTCEPITSALNLSSKQRDNVSFTPSTAGSDFNVPNFGGNKRDSILSIPSTAGSDLNVPNFSGNKRDSLATTPSSAGSDHNVPNFGGNKRDSLATTPSSAGSDHNVPNFGGNKRDSLSSLQTDINQ